MRVQSTALMTLPEKQMLEELTAQHKTTQSVILRAGLNQFASKPDEQAAWIEFTKQESERNE